MFLEIMASLDQDNPEGRMRVLSQNPRFDEKRKHLAENERAGYAENSIHIA